MKIVNINSGLGNQMFQYAFYLSLKDRFKSEDVKIDISWFDDEKFHNGYELKKIFNIDFVESSNIENRKLSRSGYALIDRIIRRILPIKKTEIIESNEQQFRYCDELYGFENKDYYYRGYWQSYKYFDLITDTIQKTFIFPKITEQENSILNSFLESNKNKTVSIHIRRGDYLTHKTLGGICNLEYYNNAISIIEQKIDSPIFIIFSNDIEWCRDNLKISNVKFVDWNKDDKSFRDMQLMSLCSHNIIANSSFSWWGAYLNTNKYKIVISPSSWTKLEIAEDLIPNNWIRI